jgi:UDP-2-acetamido-3-amino-2,3-dideoxy-glucuronate N-acetyltransferase
MIDPDVVLGKNVLVFNPDLVNLFGCKIGDESFVGPFVEITRGVTIGKRCLIESHSFLCTGVELENDVFISHGVMFTNDLYPRTDRHVVYPRTLVKQFASIGTHATILGGVIIGKHAVVGAGAVVTRDVPPLSIVLGSPAKVSRQFGSLGELKQYICERQATS